MRWWVYFGTQRSSPGTGISAAVFDSDTGRLEPPRLAAITDDPSYLVAHPMHARLYACNSGTPGGVSAWAIDRGTGALALLNRHVSRGRGPSHISFDASGAFVLAANYGGGYVEVLALGADGRLGGQTAFVQHEGRSVHRERQTGPHAHCVRVDPSNQFALVADLGLDRVLVYRFHAGTGSLVPHDPPYTEVAAGSGPRHLAWHPNGRWLYLVEELSSEVTAFEWDSRRGWLREMQTLSALPDDFTGENTSAEILVHPSGRFLYVSNRGHDSVSAFALDERSGSMTARHHIWSGGRTPRYMTLDPEGRWLIAANHDSDTVAIFRVDEDSGHLTASGDPVSLARPFGVIVGPIPHQ